MSVLQGSHRTPMAHAQYIAPVASHDEIEVSLYLRDPVPASSVRVERETFVAVHAALPYDIELVEKFAQSYDLTVAKVNRASRRVVLSGTADAMSRAFGLTLHHYQHPAKNAVFRGRSGPIMLPDALDGIVTAVLGLDTRPLASPHLRRLNEQFPDAAQHSFTPAQVAQLYNFPDTSAAEQCVGIIELGGGYRATDIHAYFKRLGLVAPRLRNVSVDGGRNRPMKDPNGADGEVCLDIEVVGAVAPGVQIVVYFAPNTDRGFVDAINAAVHDTTRKPSVISISWGGPECEWTPQTIAAMHQAFQAAAALGVTITAASGDTGSSDGVGDGLAHVDYPASDPYVLGCGGTRLHVSGQQIVNETVWNDDLDSATGGGVSELFALPDWQTERQVPPSANHGKHIGRGVPDVAGNAGPASGYQILVDGQMGIIGGTSAVAPLWAGLVALINAGRKQSLGYLHPILYQNYTPLLTAKALNDIQGGTNGAYTSVPGWDACTGLGSPNGVNLQKALT